MVIRPIMRCLDAVGLSYEDIPRCLVEEDSGKRRIVFEVVRKQYFASDFFDRDADEISAIDTDGAHQGVIEEGDLRTILFQRKQFRLQENRRQDGVEPFRVRHQS